MIINLCHFDVVLGGVRCPAHTAPLRFEPILDGPGPIRTLLGYYQPESLPELPRGTQVIVPRFAAAVSWALAAGLVPFCVPQKHLGERGRPGAPELVVDSIDDLEPAPESLSFDFPRAALAAPSPTGSPWGIDQGQILRRIQRLVQGAWPIKARGVGTFDPVMDAAYDLPHGEAHIPEIKHGVWAVIVPQSGTIIRALEDMEPGLAILVTGIPDPVTKEVDLYRVR